MKKIISIALCLGLVATSFAACSSRKYVPKEKKDTKKDTVKYEEVKYPVPEEQAVYSVQVKYINGMDAIEITGYTGDEADLVIPDKLNHEDYPEALAVLSIGDAAFLGNETLTSVVIPEGVTTLGVGAFQNCTNLTSVTLPETLTTIEDNCFYNSALTNINIPAALSTIGQFVFSSHYVQTPWYASLTDEKVIIGDGILLKYNGNASVDFGEEVKSVAYYAFKNPSQIEVTFGNALTYVDPAAVFDVTGSYNGILFKYPEENTNANMSLLSTKYKHEMISAVVAEETVEGEEQPVEAEQTVQE